MPDLSQRAKGIQAIPQPKKTEWLARAIYPVDVGFVTVVLARQALVPFVIDAQARQPGYRVPLKQLLQADDTLPCIFSQHVICKRDRETNGVNQQQVRGTEQTQV